MLRAAERKKRNRRAHVGSTQGRAPNRKRGMKQCGYLLDTQYFCRTNDATPMFTDGEFERRYRMPRNTYEMIRSAVLTQDPDFFEQRCNALGRHGASPDQKITAALRILCYGAAADQLVEILGMSESLISECLPRFCDAIGASLGGTYVREPTAEELAKTEVLFADLGFPGCVGSVDCASWEWDRCPVAWEGQFKGKKKKKCVRMEVICDDYLSISHLNFGSPGARNYLNILNSSDLFNKIRTGRYPPSRPETMIRSLPLTWYTITSPTASIHPGASL
jgi:hypothetical protein